MAGRSRDRDSAGRLLRVLRDCEPFHMEAAIASLDQVAGHGIRSESLLGAENDDDVDVVQRTPQGRVLALSDHKRIASLQAALTTVANAYDAAVGETESDKNQNLVRAVAGAAIMQAMRDCTASRLNCCIWGPQATKLHDLLFWMVSRKTTTASQHDFVRSLLLEWLQPTAEKQKQLTASLALFELLQRDRRNMTTSMPGNLSSCLLSDRSEAYMKALRGAVARGTTRVAGTSQLKPSKLALIALETLAFLCGSVAAQLLTSKEEDIVIVAGARWIHEMVESMRTVGTALQQWHLRSARRQFLVCALGHLQSYAEVCNNILLNEDQERGTSDALVAIKVLCWHWQATTPLLCTRCDAFIRIMASQPGEVLARVLKEWGSIALNFRVGYACATSPTNPEVVYAQLRHVCLLMNMIGGLKELALVFEGFSTEVKAYFVFLFVEGLSIATHGFDDAAIHFAVKVLRAILLPSDTLKLVSTQREGQALLSELLRCLSKSKAASGSRCRTELEVFVADLIISREVFIFELVARIRELDSKNVRGDIYLVRTLLYQLDNAKIQTPLYRCWRRQLTPAVVCLVSQKSYAVRRLALSCLPSLDPALSVITFWSASMPDIDGTVTASAFGFLIANSKVVAATSAPAFPAELSDYVMLLKEKAKNAVSDHAEKIRQEKLISLCFGPSGWSKYVHLADTRSKILGVLLRKTLGSPRDTLLFRMLREFVSSGWVDYDIYKGMAKLLVQHMMNQQRLNEAILDDNSSSSVSATEGLLFARLAPLLVFRLVPRNTFGANCAPVLVCGREDLDHIEEYIYLQQKNRQENSGAGLKNETETTDLKLFHILARSVVDPLEFKEVKLLAIESLAKFPPSLVLPFVFGYLAAFLRQEILPEEVRTHQHTSVVVSEEFIPKSCGLVTAKLMVYYLNRVFVEDANAYTDAELTAPSVALLVQIMGIPCAQDLNMTADASLLVDLQRGCIDCVAVILSRLAAAEIPDSKREPKTSASLLVKLLLKWIFLSAIAGIGNTDERAKRSDDEEDLDARSEKLLANAWGDINALPLQLRSINTETFCWLECDSAISRSENTILLSWKNQGIISQVVLATESCFEDDVIAGGLQIIFSFLYKANELLTMEDDTDLLLVRSCYEVTTARLESTRSEQVAISCLKVVGAFIGKFPVFVGSLPPAEIQRLINRCLIPVRDRRISGAVSELAQSLLQVISPP